MGWLPISLPSPWFLCEFCCCYSADTCALPLPALLFPIYRRIMDAWHLSHCNMEQPSRTPLTRHRAPAARLVFWFFCQRYHQHRPDSVKNMVLLPPFRPPGGHLYSHYTMPNAEEFLYSPLEHQLPFCFAYG